MKKNTTTKPRAIPTFCRFESNICPNSFKLPSTVAYAARFSNTSGGISPFAVSERAITATIGPMEHIAISPKLFSLALRPPMVVAMPTPKAIINGTVMGPVVTPPESKERGKKLNLPSCMSIAQSANSSI